MSSWLVTVPVVPLVLGTRRPEERKTHGFTVEVADADAARAAGVQAAAIWKERCRVEPDTNAIVVEPITDDGFDAALKRAMPRIRAAHHRPQTTP